MKINKQPKEQMQAAGDSMDTGASQGARTEGPRSRHGSHHAVRSWGTHFRCTLYAYGGGLESLFGLPHVIGTLLGQPDPRITTTLHA